MMILIFASPHPALETDGTEDNWRAELAAKKVVSVPKKKSCRAERMDLFCFYLFLGEAHQPINKNKKAGLYDRDLPS
jgi:hypothetical protein